MGEKKQSDGPTGLQLRSYQLEMLAENMHKNIIVAVCLSRGASNLISYPDNTQDGHRFGQDYDSGGTY